MESFSARCPNTIWFVGMPGFWDLWSMDRGKRHWKMQEEGRGAAHPCLPFVGVSQCMCMIHDFEDGVCSCRDDWWCLPQCLVYFQLPGDIMLFALSTKPAFIASYICIERRQHQKNRGMLLVISFAITLLFLFSIFFTTCIFWWKFEECSVARFCLPHNTPHFASGILIRWRSKMSPVEIQSNVTTAHTHTFTTGPTYIPMSALHTPSYIPMLVLHITLSMNCFVINHVYQVSKSRNTRELWIASRRKKEGKEREGKHQWREGEERKLSPLQFPQCQRWLAQ